MPQQTDPGADLRDLEALLLADADADPTAPTGTPLPSIPDHPAVKAAADNHQRLASEHDTVTRQRAALEQELGADAKLSEQQLRARALVRGGSDAGIVAKFDQLRAAREQEGVLSEAAALALKELGAAREQAAREYSHAARETHYLPAARLVTRMYLDWLRASEGFRRLVETLRSRGLGNGLHPFWGGGPVDASDRIALATWLREQVRQEWLSRADVEAAGYGDLV